MDGDSYRDELANIRLDMQKVLDVFQLNAKNRRPELFKVLKLMKENDICFLKCIATSVQTVCFWMWKHGNVKTFLAGMAFWIPS